ncbi:N-acetylmuramoyl-L-alanine amidase [Paucisalibacillus globulus]|uniref:N-acetylmuramoyl-L-alanine amidase n=1 Tax=Paucisalibacillus globulus TaxID=351095 RepID=UPI000BB76B1F|nr:N-acetylmuramoyl-L-alanine amidase [Paucisalibacillus globulus]
MTKPILIIDPGHGGKDPGGGTNKHWKEKDKVLDISLYQYKRFKELGVLVAITRTTDKYLSPDERTGIVRNSGAEYCISNHLNAGKGDGAEVIHSIYDDGELANRIAKAIKETGQNVRRVFTRTLPGNSKLDYYFMNRDTGKVKTNIIEYGFADSPKDDVQQLMDHIDEAESVVKAFCEHIGHKYEAPSQKKKVQPKAKEGRHIRTGGLTPEMLAAFTAFLQSKNWFAEARIREDKDKSTYVITGGLSSGMKKEAEAWLDSRGWWYTYENNMS